MINLENVKVYKNRDKNTKRVICERRKVHLPVRTHENTKK